MCGRIVEVGPRDGLQNISGPPVPTHTKLELVNRLLDSGMKVVEAGSFVRPDRVPQVSYKLIWNELVGADSVVDGRHSISAASFTASLEARWRYTLPGSRTEYARSRESVQARRREPKVGQREIDR